MQESGLGHRVCLSPAPQNCLSKQLAQNLCWRIPVLVFFIMRLILVSRKTTLYKALKVSNYASQQHPLSVTTS